MNVPAWHTSRIAAVLLALVISEAGAGFTDRGTPVGDDGVISADNLGEDEVWPLSIERGTFRCEGSAVFIVHGETAYPLDGAAKALMRHDAAGRRPLEEIWRRDEKTAADLEASGVPVETVRPDITPVLRRGTEWCRHRR